MQYLYYNIFELETTYSQTRPTTDTIFIYIYIYMYSRGYRYGWNARRAPMPDDPNSILIRDDGLFGSYAIFFFFEVRVCFLISEKNNRKTVASSTTNASLSSSNCFRTYIIIIMSSGVRTSSARAISSSNRYPRKH